MATAGLTGVLLVGGGSTRFGSPKTLAEFGDETLAERGWRILEGVCDERLAVGKSSDDARLPFAVIDDGCSVRAPLTGLVAGLRAARHDRCIFLPVDTPLVRPEHLRALADAGGEVAVPQTGPLPGVYARTALPELERRLGDGRFALRDALTAFDARVVTLDPFLLANVNTPADLELASRRARALDAAERIARSHGIDPVAPRVLQDWNDTVIQLRPVPVVARVRTTWLAGDTEHASERELAVAAYAAARAAPVVAPTQHVPPGPHRVDDTVVTLWDYVEESPGRIPAFDVGTALRALHEAIADYPFHLPSLWERLDRAQAVVDDAAASPALSENDRRFLAETLREFRTAFEEVGLPDRPLHGGPHESNLLRTAGGPRWIDFDTSCRGPVEWDVAHLPDEAAHAFPEVRADALALARRLVSAEVAVWCWHTYGRAPQVDEAAHVHLRSLRGWVCR